MNIPLVLLVSTATVAIVAAFVRLAHRPKRRVRGLIFIPCGELDRTHAFTSQTPENKG